MLGQKNKNENKTNIWSHINKKNKNLYQFEKLKKNEQLKKRSEKHIQLGIQDTGPDMGFCFVNWVDVIFTDKT